MPESISTQGTVEMVRTFSSKGGGIAFMVQIPHSRENGAILLDNTQKPAEIQITFADKPLTTEEADDAKQGRLPGAE